MVSYLEGLLNIADVFIALFIMWYAIFFLRKTRSSRHRRPWEILAVAVYFFFMAEVFTVLAQFEVVQIHGLINIFKTTFIGLILLVFTLNYDFIIRGNELVIKKR
jgi:hypothetical protein